MPQIPQYIAQRQLAADSGTPQGNATMRTTPSPLTSPGPYQEGARGLAAVGRSLRETGQGITQLAQRQQGAEDSLVTQRATELFQQQHDTGLDALHTQALMPDQETGQRALLGPGVRGQEALRQGKDRIEAIGATLTPRQRRAFQVQAEQYLSLSTRQVRDRAQKEFLHEAQQSIDLGADTLKTQWLNATDRVEAGHAAERLDTLLAGGVRDGVVTQAWATQKRTKAVEDVQVHGVQVQIRSDPAQSVQDIQARLHGKPAVLEAISQVPPRLLPKLYDEAVIELGKRVQQREHADTQARKTHEGRQKTTASTYRSAIYKPGVTIAELVALVEPINASRREQQLGEEDHGALLKDIQTLGDKLREDSFKDRDVQQIAQQGRILIESADTPAALDAARQWVLANTKGLSSTTTGSMLARITARGEANDPLSDDAVKEGRRLFLSGAFPGGLVPAIMEKIEPTIQAKTSVGLDIYQQEMRRIYESEGRTAMRAQASDVGRRLKDLYFPEAQQATGAPVGLPKAFEGIRTFEDGLIVLDSLELPQIAKRTIYQQLKQSLPRRNAAPLEPKPTLPNPGKARVPGTPN